MGIPAGLDWQDVLDAVSAFIGNAFVLAAIVAVVALRFAPKVVRAILAATRGR